MSKNIVVFSDGTGQDGGVRPEQRMSNVYKLYRACRVGPDSGIDPYEQVAFYDAGLGTDDGATALTAPIRFVQKMLGSVTGRGVTTNIAECYAFIINHYQPGDRIFLIGFSRGAYTVRAVADLIRLCGIPTRTTTGALPVFRRAVDDIAQEAVDDVLEHGAGHSRAKFEDEREELARRFREKYCSHHETGEERRSNAAPYFIGVFDTVASLGAKGVRRWLIQAGVGVFYGLFLAVISAIPSAAVAGMLSAAFAWPFWPTTFILLALAVAGSGGWLWWRRERLYRKVMRDFPNKGDVSRHRAEWKGEHFNRLLSRFVTFARSANAIDETRADFDRLPWGPGKNISIDAELDGHPRFKQLWFAGNHSDVGGSYPETQSRLSDIALQWMVEEATKIPNGLKVDGLRAPGDALGNPKLQLFPAADGLQHCEIAAMRDMLDRLKPGILARFMASKNWAAKVREIHPEALVHPSVAERFAATTVAQCNASGPYRPEALRQHKEFGQYYAEVPHV
jgi:uncharacterized protein (DUF2235 family)